MREAPGAHNSNVLPPNIPAPRDDGAAKYLAGARLPDVALLATDGASVNLSKLKGRTVVYVYPRNGVGGVGSLRAGTTSRARAAARRSLAVFAPISASLNGLVSSSFMGCQRRTAYQREPATRLHLPFAILSDEKFALTKALKLPIFTTSGMTLLKRMALVTDDGVITKAFYPAFPPDKNSEDVLAWPQASK
jgi:peroxiredoxin